MHIDAKNAKSTKIKTLRRQLLDKKKSKTQKEQNMQKEQQK